MAEQFSQPTPEEARRALSVAADAGIATAADRTRLERGLVVIGVAVGVLVLALRLTVGDPDAPGWFRVGGLAVVMALYAVAITVAVVSMRRASAAPRGFTLRYGAGLGVTMLFYGVYVIASSVRGDDALPWSWVILAAIITAAPALLAARSISTLALK